MVKINDEKRSATIEIEMCESGEIAEMQTAIIDLLSCYNYKDFGNGCAPTVYYATKLLQALLPNEEQQELALGTNRGWLKIPESLSINRRMDLVIAVNMIETGEKDLTDNKVYQALTKAGRA